ncbi:MAG: hypothetical protein BroJett038_31650 [Chloroflexota bacterium]|nr:MAG: hypothetical protein BroJett038_31650 [Chloroflexota bacterium]
MTQFLADESCAAVIVHTLRALGYDVVYVAELAPGISDSDILAQGNREKRIIVTEDRDFCELVFRDNKPTYGVVLVRIPVPHRSRKADRITELVNNYADQLPSAMTTVFLNRIKIRPLGKKPETN